MSAVRAPIKLPARPSQDDIRYALLKQRTWNDSLSRFFAPAYHGYDIESAVFFAALQMQKHHYTIANLAEYCYSSI